LSKLSNYWIQKGELTTKNHEERAASYYTASISESNSATLMLISVVPPQQCSQIATPNTFTYINQTTPEKLLKENYRP
jgi:hypothetical protein